MSRSPAIVFFGTPEISVPFLDALVAADLAPALVVTQPDRLVGRKQVLTPPAVKVAAQRHSLAVSQIASFKNSAALTQLQTLNADVYIVVAFGLIFPRSVLELPSAGCFNLHASLLPKYRGASPIQWAILDGATVTGWTLMRMDPGVDTGPVLAQMQVPVALNETTPSLSTKLAGVGGEFLAAELPKFLKGELTAQPQDNSLATHTKLLTKESGQLDWSLSAVQLERQIRAFQPWPGSYTHWRDLKIELLAAEATAEPAHQPPGTVIEADSRVGIATGQGTLWPISIKPAGKNAQSATDFMRGHLGFLGSRLG